METFPSASGTWAEWSASLLEIPGRPLPDFMEMLQGLLGATASGLGRVGQATCPIPAAGTVRAAGEGQAACGASGTTKVLRGVAAHGKKSILAGSQEAFARGEQLGLLGKLELGLSRNAGEVGEQRGTEQHPQKGSSGCILPGGSQAPAAGRRAGTWLHLCWVTSAPATRRG